MDYGDGAYQRRAQEFGAVHYNTWGIDIERAALADTVVVHDTPGVVEEH